MSVYDPQHSNYAESEDSPFAPRPQPKKTFYNDYAKLSQAAYNPTGFADSTRAAGYDINRTLSSREATVYVHQHTGKAVISYKGTSPGQWARFKKNDFAADVGIGLGIREQLNGRFRQAADTYQRAVAMYGAKNVEVTGHSLGGSQALYVGRKFNAKGIAFEPGVGPGNAVDRLDDSIQDQAAKVFHKAFRTALPNPANRTHVQIVASKFRPDKSHSAALNLISGLAHLPGREKTTWVTQKGWNSHGIENFL